MAERPIVSFQKELAHLKGFYATVQHSFRAVAAEMAGEIDNGRSVSLQSLRLNSAVTYSTKLKTLLNKMDADYPQTLRDLLLVRIISALEVFLIRSIRAVFLARRDLFHAESKIEFQLSELLSSQSIAQVWEKIIARETRRLQSRGFEDIVRFMSARIRIDFSASPVLLDSIRILHQKRHLLVHRLGRTDDEYRHKFNASETRVGLGEPELIAAFHEVAEFAFFVHRRVEAICLELSPTPADSDVDLVFQLTVKCAEVLPPVLREDFVFAVGDALFSTADVARNRHIKSDGNHVLFVAGASVTVHAYMDQIRAAASRGELSIVNIVTVHSRATDLSDLSRELLEEIARALPPWPLPQNIHHMIAERFNLTRGLSWAAIGRVLRDETLSALIAKIGAE